MSEPARILTVCTGNVCRSPYIERRLQHELDRAWGPGAVEVSSAGTGALVDAAMDPDALSRLGAAGGAGEDFRARAITRELVADAQLVIVATRDHRGAVSRLYPRALSRIHALRDLAQLAEGVADDELPGRTSARAWLDEVVPLIASKRGLRPPLEPREADVVDPFRQGRDVFDTMSTQVEDALPQVLRVLGAGAGAGAGSR